MEWHSFYYKGHETNIEVNKLGEVRRVPKDWVIKNVYNFKKSIIYNTPLKLQPTSHGYYAVSVSIKNLSRKIVKVHIIVASVFLNYTPMYNGMVVDHIDNNKINNQLENLQIISSRSNTAKRIKPSKYPTGVYCKKLKTGHIYYGCQIYIKNVKYHIGNHKTPEEASAAYQEALRKINAGEFATN